MWIKQILMAVMGISFGALSAGGVFTVFIAVGLIPRFAGKTNTANKVFLYEEMVTFGAITGCIFSVFYEYLPLGKWLLRVFAENVWNVIGSLFLITFGAFAGMFVGCLAFAIAEMLDTIPIFARRIGFRHGLGIAITAMAIGKAIGSLLYFSQEIYRYAM